MGHSRHQSVVENTVALSDLVWDNITVVVCLASSGQSIYLHSLSSPLLLFFSPSTSLAIDSFLEPNEKL